MKKAGWLKDAVATTGGYFTKTGKKLKGVKLSQEFVDQWNGVVEKVEEVVEAVETIVEAEEIVETPDHIKESDTASLEMNEKPKRKYTRKKKSLGDVLKGFSAD